MCSPLWVLQLAYASVKEEAGKQKWFAAATMIQYKWAVYHGALGQSGTVPVLMLPGQEKIMQNVRSKISLIDSGSLHK